MLLLSLHVESEALRHSISFAVGFSALTFLHISAGELAPKWAAIQNPLPISLWVAQPLKWFYLASYPFNWLLNQAARWLGVVFAFCNALAQMLMIQAYPFWSLALLSLDILVMYALVVYGGRSYRAV